LPERDAVPRVTVVVFLRDVPSTAGETLASLHHQQRFDAMEVIVADGSGGDAGKDLCTRFPWVRRLPLSPASMPALKGAAIRAARGDIVAILDPTDAAEPDWVDEILEGFTDPGTSAVGGEVTLAGPPTPANRAAYLFEYGAFTPPVSPGPTEGDLPGNNVAYRRRLLVEDGADLLEREGFNKPFFHQHIRQGGGKLVLRPGMRVRHLTRHRFLPFATRRFHYGRCFGANRRRLGRPGFRAPYLVLAPVIPFLLLVRHFHRALQHPRHRRWLRGAGPALAGICVAWGVGEWMGAWFGPGRSCRMLY
jgi:hypothetical protein